MGLFSRTDRSKPAEIIEAARQDDAEDADRARWRLLDQAAKDTEHRAGPPTGRIGGNQ
ncbi:hypothetical protein [Micromonospora zhanjiangensis]|uniref:Uncharacterized protein n=1 Tax=Micromonospora zhanjiangensis TaxID=1522057 RepID=A0ABV8KZA4_9ACTN